MAGKQATCDYTDLVHVTAVAEKIDAVQDVKYNNKVQRLVLHDYMLFSEFDMVFSPYINIICGINSTGKTAILKTIHALMAAEVKDKPANEAAVSLTSKLAGVFRPDRGDVGHLVRQGNESASFALTLSSGGTLSGNISGGELGKIVLDEANKLQTGQMVFLPSKEIISVHDFAALYKKYHISFEETYYDLAQLLELPARRSLSPLAEKVVSKLSETIGANVVRKDGRFYLEMSGTVLEMGLVSEGYRKIAILMQLILNGSLEEGSILFWDEPETGMNPKMMKPLVQAIVVLAGLGVQVFVATHDYFMQQYLSMASLYEDQGKEYAFISLYRENDGILAERAKDLLLLEHNAIMEEFDEVYNRELAYLV